ncbi:MAG: type II secretion system protein GspJ [Pseudomonadota bacterium]
MIAQKGFTLLEVMVSIAIVAMIMLLVWSSTNQTLDSKERVEYRDAIYQNGRIAFQKMTDDLAMAFLIKQPPVRTGINPRPTTFFIGEDEGNRDKLRFTSFSHMRFFKGAKESDQCKIAYEVMPDPEDYNVFNLVRREQAYLDAETTLETKPYIVAENIEDFELEYYDYRKDEWVKSWDSENIDYAGKIPRAVRMLLSFPDPDEEGKTIDLSSAVFLPMSYEQIDF